MGEVRHRRGVLHVATNAIRRDRERPRNGRPRALFGVRADDSKRIGETMKTFSFSVAMIAACDGKKVSMKEWRKGHYLYIEEIMVVSSVSGRTAVITVGDIKGDWCFEEDKFVNEKREPLSFIQAMTIARMGVKVKLRSWSPDQSLGVNPIGLIAWSETPAASSGDTSDGLYHPAIQEILSEEWEPIRRPTGFAPAEGARS